MTDLERLLARTAVIGGIEGPREMSCADYEVLVGLARQGMLEIAPLLEDQLRAVTAVRDLLDTLARVRDERDRALGEIATLSEKLDTLRNSLVMVDVRALLREVL